MNYFEKIQKPHAIYRFFRDDGALLYVGLSLRPMTRLEVHACTKSWYREITRMEIRWFPDYLTAARAEQSAINDEAPLHNKLVFSQGDGTTCPRCGGPKEHKLGKAYCGACYAEYRVERARAAGVRPKPPPSVTCPRCSGIKDAGKGYCRPCKRQVDKEYRAARR